MFDQPIPFEVADHTFTKEGQRVSLMLRTPNCRPVFYLLAQHFPDWEVAKIECIKAGKRIILHIGRKAG